MPSAAAVRRSAGPRGRRKVRGTSTGAVASRSGKSGERLGVIRDLARAEHADGRREEERLQDRARQDVRGDTRLSAPELFGDPFEVAHLHAPPRTVLDREEGKEVRLERDHRLATRLRHGVRRAPQGLDQLGPPLPSPLEKTAGDFGHLVAERVEHENRLPVADEVEQRFDERLAVGLPGRVPARELVDDRLGFVALRALAERLHDSGDSVRDRALADRGPVGSVGALEDEPLGAVRAGARRARNLFQVVVVGQGPEDRHRRNPAAR